MLVRLKKYPFVQVMGFVENEGDFWRGLSLMLVPHLYGSGVRIKSLEALAFGIPVITHSESASRLDPNVRAEALAKDALYVSDEAHGWLKVLMNEEDRLLGARRLVSQQTLVTSIYYDFESADRLGV
ncbi:MAG: glycosyltransferase [Bdellovibrionales bacterium]|nr:glycosyltransferase [Bdellovibrionales bacterium]